MKRTLAILAPLALLTLAATTACEPLETERDVMGNYEVEYLDNMRVYIGDELVAEVESGEDATIEWDGQTFQVSAICGEEGTECPAETFWGQVAVDQPWGTDNKLLNFVNLDQELGVPGQRLGGIMEQDGSFDMLAGLGIAANQACAVLGVGVVMGQFNASNDEITDGVIAYGWSGGCMIGEVAIGTTLRLETDYTAVRTGDYDVSSVTPEEPIDEEGEVIDPEQPEEI